jgi:DNA-binding NarL/FixJ family response regulator
MRVVVANQPRLLRESIAAALAVQGEIEVAVGAANAAAIVRSVEQHKPDCIILSLEVREANPRICRTVLSRYPQTLILAIGPKTLTVYWFDVIVRSARKECSLQSIFDLLRSKPTEIRLDATSRGNSTERMEAVERDEGSFTSPQAPSSLRRQQKTAITPFGFRGRSA